jgi:hypothetical protein
MAMHIDNAADGEEVAPAAELMQKAHRGAARVDRRDARRQFGVRTICRGNVG